MCFLAALNAAGENGSSQVEQPETGIWHTKIGNSMNMRAKFRKARSNVRHGVIPCASRHEILPRGHGLVTGA
jgi:hypothetical protein